MNNFLKPIFQLKNKELFITQGMLLKLPYLDSRPKLAITLKCSTKIFFIKKINK